MSVVWTLITGLIAFLGGWLLASEKLRAEAFKRKLDAYAEINKIAANLLLLNIKAEADYDEFMVALVETRLELASYMATHNLFISEEVGGLINELTVADEKPDAEKIRVSFNQLVETMASELRLKAMHVVSSALTNPLSLLEHLRKK